jgi:hypothetical protein
MVTCPPNKSRHHTHIYTRPLKGQPIMSDASVSGKRVSVTQLMSFPSVFPRWWKESPGVEQPGPFLPLLSCGHSCVRSLVYLTTSQLVTSHRLEEKTHEILVPFLLPQYQCSLVSPKSQPLGTFGNRRTLFHLCPGLFQLPTLHQQPQYPSWHPWTTAPPDMLLQPPLRLQRGADGEREALALSFPDLGSHPKPSGRASPGCRPWEQWLCVELNSL